MSLWATRAGRGEIELGLNQTALERGLASARNKLQSFASKVSAFGAFLAGGGIGAALTAIPVAMIFATYEQELANLRAATNPTVERFGAMREAIEKLARSTGENPADVAKVFTELAKAGVSIEDILNGAGQAAVMFGRVSGMAVGETATILADAMNVFRRDGLSAMQIATILNRAADASSISLRDVADAIGASGSTMALWNQSLNDTATLIGILGNYGIKGAEGGTALKTFFLRLTSGSDGAAAAMQQLGLVIRDANGNVLPAIEIIRRLGEATRGMGLEQRDAIFAQLAGARGIRALAVLTQEGAAGFEAFQRRMNESLNIQQRFAIITDTLSGAFRRMWVSIQLAAIKIGDILLPSIRSVMIGIQSLFGMLEIVAIDNPEIIRGFFLAAVALTSFGVAMYFAGKSLELVASLMSPFISVLRVMQTVLFSLISSLIAFTASSYMAGISLFGMTYRIAAAVVALTLYKIALLAVAVVQAITSGGLSLLYTGFALLAGVVLKVAIAALMVSGGFLLIAGASALFISLGGSFAEIAEWLQVVDDVIRFLADSFYGFIDAVMGSPIGGMILWVWELVENLATSFGLVYDAFMDILEQSGALDLIRNAFIVIAGIVAFWVTLFALAAYAAYQFVTYLLDLASLQDIFAFINREIRNLWFILREFAQFIRPVIDAIAGMFLAVYLPFLEIGRRTLSNVSYLFLDTFNGITRQIAIWFESVSNSIGISILTIRDRFSEMFNRVAGDVVVIWQALQNAFSAGNWRLLWDIAVITFRLAWHEISSFAVDVFYAIGDLLVDIFDSTVLLIQNTFTRLWGNIQAGFLGMMATVLETFGVGEIAAAFAAIGIDVGGIGQAGERLRGQALDARRVAGNEIRGRNQEAEFDAIVAQVERDIRNAVRMAGNDAAGAALRDELDRAAIAAWFEAQAAMVDQEIAAAGAGRRNFGDGGEAQRQGLSAIGTFSADVARGFIGAGPETPLERANRELAEANRIARQQAALLAQILARVGLPVFGR